MVLDIYEGQEDDPDEPTDPNETRLALAWLFTSTGTIDFQDSQWTADFDGQNGLEFHDDENGTIAYIPPGANGDITEGSTADNGGADETATYVTLEDETTELENSQQHANLSGTDLHDPAEHGNEAHSDSYATTTEVDGKADDPHALGGDSHSSDTLANLNTLIDDATLDDEGDTRPAEPHALGGGTHDSDTLANLNSKISDAVLDDEGDTRPPEDHDNTAHSAAFIADGDGTERQYWVVAAGASDPAGADPDDIIFEEES